MSFLNSSVRNKINSISLLVFILISCKKPGITYEKFQASNLNVVCAWDADDIPVAFSLDTTVRLYGGDLYYAEQTYYQVLFSGQRVAKFKDENGTLIYSVPISMEDKKAYTLFYTGTQANPESVFVEDDVSSPGDNKTRFRIANMNPDPNSKYDIYFETPLMPMQKVFSTIGSKTVSAPVIRDSTTQVITITAINPGVDTLVYQEPTIRFLAERAYTIVIVGKKNGINPQEILITENYYTY